MSFIILMIIIDIFSQLPEYFISWILDRDTFFSVSCPALMAMPSITPGPRQWFDWGIIPVRPRRHTGSWCNPWYASTVMIAPARAAGYDNGASKRSGRGTAVLCVGGLILVVRPTKRDRPVRNKRSGFVRHWSVGLRIGRYVHQGRREPDNADILTVHRHTCVFSHTNGKLLCGLRN